MFASPLKALSAALVVAAFMLSALAPAQAADPIKTTVTFLLTNDIYKLKARKRGGFARLAAVVKAERAKGGNLIYAHAGDAISPSLMSGFDKGEHIITLLNMAAPDYFVPGNHEFDFGPDVFLKRMGEGNFGKLAANLRGKDGKPLPGFRDSVIVTFDGVKIGLVGLTAEDAREKSSPGYIQILDMIATAREQAAALRKQGADLIVAIAHANSHLDRRLLATRAFDILLSGDDHDLTVFYNGRRLLVESGEEAEYVTAIDVAIKVKERKGRRKVKWHPSFRIIDTATITPDAQVQAKLDGYLGELSKELDVAVGTTATELDSRKATVRGGEAAIGNLITDAMRAAVGADICITNGGGIRGKKNYAPGSKITRRDILIELPFGNVTVMYELTGAQIRAALENGYSKIERGSGRFAQVSGLKVVVDTKKPAGQRVVSVMVSDAPLDPARTYKVATNDFMARGGDGYTQFRQGKVLIRALDGKLMANDVMAYIRKKGTVSPKVEGRVVLK
jgi:2',3'-cyclic-nucleotide 2'-phosphodiesterase (5'-nucleotidase family)